MYYNNQFFYYPVQAFDALQKLGLSTSIVVLFSYLRARLAMRHMEPKNFEEWITKHFGRKLFEILFKTYTEKVWGISCDEIGEEWAAQRIKNLNLFEAVKHAIFKKKKQKKIRSFIEQFEYPVKGAGMMYKAMKREIEQRGGKIFLESPVVALHHNDERITGLEVKQKGTSVHKHADFYLSSMPLTEFVLGLYPLPEERIIAAARKLRYRAHITVNLIIDRAELFPDNWIYVHSPEVKMARIANYANFSKAMIGKEDTAGLSVEYFAFEGDELWNMSDKALIELATQEMELMKLLKPEEVLDGFVVREKDSYPTYYMGYKEPFEVLKGYVSQFRNLQLIGRGGLYKYNNQDHAILTGILAARNLLGAYYDIWAINVDEEYLEEKKMK